MKGGDILSAPVDELKNRLKMALSIRDLKPVDLVEKTKIPKSAISQYMSGYAKPKQDRIYLISEALNINEAWLLGYDVPMEKDQNVSDKIEGVKIPVLGYVAAGIPIDAIEYIIDYEEIPQEMARTGEFFALKIKGNSMEPRICNGDVVIVKKQPDVNNGEIAIVLVNGDEATCKKIKKNELGINLIPLNTAGYDVMFYTNEQIIELPVIILGKVVELRGKF